MAWLGVSSAACRDLVAWAAERCIGNFSNAASAQDYLRTTGVTSPIVWSEFRLGVGDEAMAKAWDADQRRLAAECGILVPRSGNTLVGPGVVLPTYDPRRPSHAVGLVRITPGQNKHRFITTPAGVGCVADIEAQERVVLVDTPMLALRLAQAGVRGVAYVEDPVVLTPLRTWFAGRSTVIVHWRTGRSDALRAALGSAGERAQSLTILPDLAQSPRASLLALGIDLETVSPPKVAPPLTLRHLNDLHAYASARLAAGEAGDALRRLGIDLPEVVDAYRIGYVPSRFRAALDPETGRAMAGRRIGGCVVVPAYDEQGRIVDLLGVQARDTGGAYITMEAEPMGLLGPSVITSFDSLIVTDSLRLLGRFHRCGSANVLLVRGPADAARNAARIAAAGVRRVEVRALREADRIAAALTGAGVSVTLAPRGDWPTAGPAVADGPFENEADGGNHVEDVRAEASLAAPVGPGNKHEAVSDDGSIPVLVEHDRLTRLATFVIGPVRYVVSVPLDHELQTEVVLRHGSHVHRDRFDLAVAAQRARFATGAARLCGLDADRIAEQLAAVGGAVLRQVESEAAEEDALPPRVEPTGEDRDRALATLRDPALLDRLADDLEGLGWVGEAPARRLLLLAATSRKLGEPLWVVRSASPQAEAGEHLALVAALTPPEDLVRVSRLTDHALYYQNPHALRHKLLVIDAGDRLSAAAAIALRVLHARGALSLAQVPRHNLGGSARTETLEVRGPVAVLTATTQGLDEALLARCCDVPVDESPEQTARVLAAERRRRTDPGRASVDWLRSEIAGRHHALQRLLAPLPVVIPFAERIAFPARSVRHRRDQERFLALIEASALLHQYQRLCDRGRLVADERDFAIALAVASAAGIGADPTLGKAATQLLEALSVAELDAATMEDCQRLLPSWGRTPFRRALGELVRLGYLISAGGGRGKVRTYRRTTGEAGAPADRIRLLPVGGLVGDGHQGVTNHGPCTASG